MPLEAPGGSEPDGRWAGADAPARVEHGLRKSLPLEFGRQRPGSLLPIGEKVTGRTSDKLRGNERQQKPTRTE